MSRYGTHFTEPHDWQVARRRLRRALRTRDDWRDIEDLIRHEAARSVLRVLDGLQREIATWQQDPYGVGDDPLGDLRDRVVDLLRDHGADASEPVTTAPSARPGDS